MEPWKEITHDAFSRESIVRQTVHILAWNNGATCTWCGQTSHDHHGKARLFKYAVWDDSFGARINPIRGEFCSISCMRTYSMP